MTVLPTSQRFILSYCVHRFDGINWEICLSKNLHPLTLLQNISVLKMDEKFDFDVKNKKSAPKKGRRAGLGFFTLSTKDSGNQEESNDKEFLSPRLREGKAGGWGEETLKSNRDQIGSAVKDFDDGVKSWMKSIFGIACLTNSSWKEMQQWLHIDISIPVIPNLEDTGDEEFINKIAKAPLIGVNRVATYKELENDLLKHTAFASLEEVNLRILTNHLYPESVLSEADEPWTKDTLLSEVISAMNEERERDISMASQ